MYQVFHTFIAKLILIEIFFPWTHGIVHDHILWVSNYISEQKTVLGVIPKFNTNPTFSWWKFQIVTSAPSFWNQTFSNLVLLNFSELSYLCDFVTTWLHSNDELETIYEGFYEIEDTLIFAWSSIPNVGHHCWLCGLIHWLFSNNKAYYLVRTIWCILDFLWLWTTIMA
jgi:hypothetical protein